MKTHCPQGHPTPEGARYRSGHCRRCTRLRALAWRLCHPERYRANQRAWRERRDRDDAARLQAGNP